MKRINEKLEKADWLSARQTCLRQKESLLMIKSQDDLKRIERFMVAVPELKTCKHSF